MENPNRVNLSFDTLEEIVDHIRGKFPQMVWVGKDYSIADLCRDLEKIAEENDMYDDEIDLGDYPWLSAINRFLSRLRSAITMLIAELRAY